MRLSVADAGVSLDHDMRPDPGSGADLDVLADHGIRAHLDVIGQLSVGWMIAVG